MTTLTIFALGHHPTVRFAAEELGRYLDRMTGRAVTISAREAYAPEVDSGIWVGEESAIPGVELPAVEDARMDDAVHIDMAGAAGVLAGTNARSALLAVYRYLTELGCRWVRPGADGEYVPRVALEETRVHVIEAASYRHRGLCIEGAVSREHVREIVEWAPRVGMNSYFIQFREGYTFFDRWYSHTGNPLKEPEGFTIERARELTAYAAEEIKRRDLIFHAVGHGWTCEPFGLAGLGWDYAVEVPDDYRQYLALVDGKRELCKGVLLDTNLCWSNPEVRRRVVDDVVQYAAAHPEVDLLHFWLGDGSNNNCECEGCRDTRPSDFYVRMLNDVDARLTELGLNTRMVFLIYVDLLWPPVKEQLINPDRFVMMFAPITRSYSRIYVSEGVTPSLPEFNRNHLVFPRSVEENVAFLKAWQTLFPRDSFDFDYHFMWDHYSDPGYTKIATILHGDIQHLADIGLNGLISCQVQRAFFPTGLPMVVMGWTLWNKQRELEEMTRDYFAAAFGPQAEVCRAYLERLSDLFDPVAARGERPEKGGDAIAADLDRIPAVVEGFRPVIEANLGLQDPCQAASWQYLVHHADLCILLSAALAAKARGAKEEARGEWQRARDLVCSREDSLHHVLDGCLFVQTLDAHFAS